MSRGRISTLGNFAVPDRGQWLADRIVAVIDVGVPSFGHVDGEWVVVGWRTNPGAMPWWEVRQRIGGRVGSAEFAGAVEGLLAEGRLIEVWLKMPDGRDAPHCLLLPGRSDALRHPVARARGVPEVLEAEPWHEGLAGP